MNKVGGFLQRIDYARKYAFGAMCILKDDKGQFPIRGAWIFRGQAIPPMMVEVRYVFYMLSSFFRGSARASGSARNRFLIMEEQNGTKSAGGNDINLSLDRTRKEKKLTFLLSLSRGTPPPFFKNRSATTSTSTTGPRSTSTTPRRRSASRTCSPRRRRSMASSTSSARSSSRDMRRGNLEKIGAFERRRGGESRRARKRLRSECVLCYFFLSFSRFPVPFLL